MWGVSFLTRNGLVTNTNKEIVEFGLKQIQLVIINGISTLIVGLLFHMLAESFLFLIFYGVLRSFAGGYHAKTIKKCYAISMILVVVGFWTLYLQIWTKSLSTISVIICSTILFFNVPVENNNRQLDDIERQKFRFIALVILGLECTLAIVMILIDFKVLYYSLVLSLVMTTLLILFQKYKLFKAKL